MTRSGKAAGRASAVVKRSLSIAGHATSISLEEPFWRALKEIATREGANLAGLVARVDQDRRGVNLSSALRLHVLAELQRRAVEPSAQPTGR